MLLFVGRFFFSSLIFNSWSASSYSFQRFVLGCLLLDADFACILFWSVKCICHIHRLRLAIQNATVVRILLHHTWAVREMVQVYQMLYFTDLWKLLLCIFLSVCLSSKIFHQQSRSQCIIAEVSRPVLLSLEW